MRLRVAVQGVPGCFSQQAARELDPAAEIVFTADFADLFAAVRDGRAERALVPVENSIVGTIAATRLGLADPAFRPVAETRLRIEHCLWAPPCVALTAVQQVLSHPVALAQCQRFLSGYPAWRQVEYFDTAGSVQAVIASPPSDRAAIASRQAGELYGAALLASDIGDRQDNFTRFVLIRKA